jgi:hypothetical protein
MDKQTHVSIAGEDWHINGKPTYAGRSWNGHRIEGLLMNARFVQATFDDLNPETRDRWRMPDGSDYDADANTQRFLEFLPSCHAHGLLGFTINLQGGSPQGYSKHQPWHNSTFNADGDLREEYLDRTGRIIDAADRLGMVVILGLFYFGQDERLTDEAAVCRGVDNAVDWLLSRRDRNVVIEIANESDIDDCRFEGNFHYEHTILRNTRGEELIERVKNRSGGKLLTSTSYRGGGRLTPNVARVADFILLHGNSVNDPAEFGRLIDDARACDGYHGQPIVVNEDDHFDYSDAGHLATAIGRRAGWGLFDYRLENEPFEAGYQSVPTDWSMNHPRKQGFFDKLQELTGTKP